MKNMKKTVGGEAAGAAGAGTIPVMDPVTGELIDTVPAATAEDIERALDRAQEGKKIWGALTMRERADIILKASAMVMEHMDPIATLLTKETGKVYKQACGEVRNASGLLRAYAEKGRCMYETILPHQTDLIMVKHEPLGVIACVVPFNFPIEMYAQKVAPALVAGNAVIVKPATDTPLSAVMISAVLHEAGVPQEALQVVTGRGSVIGKLLSGSPKIDGISLTGSTEVGIDIASNAAKHITRTYLELGGNDALIVLDDADMDKAVAGAVACRIYCAGQVCSASKRFLVDNKIREGFTQRLVERLRAVKMGDPFDAEMEMGSLISEKAAKEVERQVRHTVAQGAKCVLGGSADGAFFAPTVLTDVTPEMDIAKDMEVFGPVFPIIGFDTDEEAVEIANASSYGLAGGVVTESMARGQKMADRLDTGMVVINPPHVYRTFDIPFGGHKMSGIGNEGAYVTLTEMMQIKTVVMTKMR